MALSKASREPEPIEKCPVAAASPISTTFSWCQVSQITRGNCIHTAEPRRWAAFDISSCPPKWRSKMRRQVSTVSSLLMSAKPSASQTSGVVSTMNVAVVSSNW